MAYLNAENAHQDFENRKNDVLEMKRRLRALVQGVSVELTEAVEEMENSGLKDSEIQEDREEVVGSFSPEYAFYWKKYVKIPDQIMHFAEYDQILIAFCNQDQI